MPGYIYSFHSVVKGWVGIRENNFTIRHTNGNGISDDRNRTVRAEIDVVKLPDRDRKDRGSPTVVGSEQLVFANRVLNVGAEIAVAVLRMSWRPACPPLQL